MKLKYGVASNLNTSFFRHIKECGCLMLLLREGGVGAKGGSATFVARIHQQITKCRGKGGINGFPADLQRRLGMALGFLLFQQQKKMNLPVELVAMGMQDNSWGGCVGPPYPIPPSQALSPAPALTSAGLEVRLWPTFRVFVQNYGWLQGAEDLPPPFRH